MYEEGNKYKSQVCPMDSDVSGSVASDISPDQIISSLESQYEDMQFEFSQFLNHSSLGRDQLIMVSYLSLLVQLLAYIYINTSFLFPY